MRRDGVVFLLPESDDVLGVVQGMELGHFTSQSQMSGRKVYS